MARTADFFQILRSNMDLLEEENKSTLIDDVQIFLSSALFGRDLDKICLFDLGSDEAKIYGELSALPKKYTNIRV